MTVSRLTCLGLVALVLTLAPAAHASPPDESWRGGLYDNADFDDVVLLITGNLGAVQPPIVWSVRPVASVVALVPSMGPAQRPLFALASAPGRAPPLASPPRS